MSNLLNLCLTITSLSSLSNWPQVLELQKTELCHFCMKYPFNVAEVVSEKKVSALQVNKG